MSRRGAVDPTHHGGVGRLGRARRRLRARPARRLADDPAWVERQTLDAADLHVDLSKNLLDDEVEAALLALADEVDAGRRGATRCSPASTSTSPRTGRCSTPRSACRPIRVARRSTARTSWPTCTRCWTGSYAFAERVRSGEWTGVTGRADRDGRQHRHRRLRPRPGDGLRGARALPPGRADLPLHQQHRPDRRRADAGRARPRDDAVHRLQQDLRDARDAHQRPAVQGVAARAACRPAPTPATPSRSTSSPSRPRSTRSPTSASTPTTRSASGTGSAVATRWTPPSACRSSSPSGPTASPSCWPASTRWTSTSAPHPPRPTCRSGWGCSTSGTPTSSAPTPTPCSPTRSCCTGSRPTSSSSRWSPTARACGGTARPSATTPARSSGASPAPTASTRSTS